MQNRLPVTSYLFSVFRFLAVKKLLVYIIAVLAATKEWDYCSNKTLADIRGLTLSPKKIVFTVPLNKLAMITENSWYLATVLFCAMLDRELMSAAKERPTAIH